LPRFACLFLLGACSFGSAALPPGAEIDARPPDAPLADARPPDGPADARPADAAPISDGGLCPTTPTPLVLSSSSFVSGTTGSSSFAASCAQASGDERIYSVEVPNTILPVDLVVQVEDSGAFDSAVEVTQTCQPGAGETCANVAPAGTAEVAVVPYASAGTHYVVVDNGAPGGGSFGVQAFLRNIASEGQPCAVNLIASRCTAGSVCVDKDDNGQAACEVLQVIEINRLAGCANTLKELVADSVIGGVLESASDEDLVVLNATAAGVLRVVATGDNGGCAGDIRVELWSAASKDQCPGTTKVAEDDNGGLGACPLLTSPIAADTLYFLRIQPGRAASVAPGGLPYKIVIDFGYGLQP
jgi:hypothetical protein